MNEFTAGFIFGAVFVALPFYSYRKRMLDLLRASALDAKDQT